MDDATFPISLPQPDSDAEKIRMIAKYFQIDEGGDDMARLTTIRKSSLDRILRGETMRPRQLAAREHLSVLAAFVQEMREFLIWLTGESTPQNAGGMRDWLKSGWVLTSVGRKRPIEALSDPKLAIEALNDIRRMIRCVVSEALNQTPKS